MKNQYEEYATYLLKNHHALRRDAQILRMGMQFAQNNAAVEETPGFGGLDTIYRAVNKRMQQIDPGALEQMVATAEIELKRLDAAVDALDERMRDIIKDLYYHKLSWTQVSMRRYISPNTLNRYRKKGIGAIARALCGYGLLTPLTKQEQHETKLTG
ncbi:hypothetical protein LJC55_00250 [Eubacteriales bacterium OttesenSCG-928-N14]|nr:hypothetical protein [Eubacteriales bacterium OttesenSCG-928-N14]